MKNIAASLFMLASLSACASAVSGTTQSLSVDTNPRIIGTTCELSNDKGRWTASNAPTSLMVKKSYNPMAVSCTAKKGKKAFSGATSAESHTIGAAFGNILLGGVIGAAVDMSNGSAYEYPTTIMVNMTEDK